jgi:hypothetical protein
VHESPSESEESLLDSSSLAAALTAALTIEVDLDAAVLAAATTLAF